MCFPDMSGFKGTVKMNIFQFLPVNMSAFTQWEIWTSAKTHGRLILSRFIMYHRLWFSSGHGGNLSPKYPVIIIYKAA